MGLVSLVSVTRVGVVVVVAVVALSSVAVPTARANCPSFGDPCPPDAGAPSSASSSSSAGERPPPAIVVAPAAQNAMQTIVVPATAPEVDPVTVVVERAAPAPARTVVVVERPSQSTPAPAPAPPEADDDGEQSDRPRGVSAIGFWVEGVSLVDIGLTFDSPETIPEVVRSLNLEGRREAFGDTVIGGATFTFGWRSTSWLRGPDFRFYIGGGDTNGAWFHPEGAPDGVQLELASVFAIKGEASLGLGHAFGPLMLFADLRAAYAGYYVTARAHDQTLGDLGEGTMSTGAFELGAAAGAGIVLGDGCSLQAAYRRTWTGAVGEGFEMTFAYEWDAD